MNTYTKPDQAGVPIGGTTNQVLAKNSNTDFDYDWTNGFSLPSLTAGSVLFSNGTTIAQDNANFFWDDTNNRLGLGTATPVATLNIYSGNIVVGNTASTVTITTPVNPGWVRAITIDQPTASLILQNGNADNNVTMSRVAINNPEFRIKVGDSNSTAGYLSIYSDTTNIFNAKITGIEALTTIKPRTGTATAGTAPIKFTAGTNLSTTEAGAIEYDGTHLYFTATNAGTRYQLDQQGGGTVTSVSGTTNRITVATGTTTPVIDISASYVGQSSITTLGTIATGVWQGTAIADAYIASAATWNAKESALTFSTGLTRSTNTITADLSTGISGGQSVVGGTASGNSLTISSTSNATKGFINFGTNATTSSVYDETNKRLGLLTNAPTHSLTLGSTANGIAIYNTSDQTTNYERLGIGWSSNNIYLSSQNGGSGSLRNLVLAASTGSAQTIGNHRLTISNSGVTGVFQFAVANADTSNNIVTLGTTSGSTANSSTSQTWLNINPGIAHTGTATFVGIDVNPSFTSVGAGTNLGMRILTGAVTQLRLAYDASNFSDITTSSTGALIFAPSGGTTVFQGGFQTAATQNNSNFSVPNASSAAQTVTASQLIFGGASQVSIRRLTRGNSNVVITAGNSYGGTVWGQEAVTIAGSGTHALFASTVFKPLSITAGAGTLTNSATLYVEGAATGATNNYSLWIAAGVSRLDGDLKLSTAGNGLYIKEGTNATMGTCTLVAGTCTVSTTKVTANSRIFLTAQALGTVTVGQGLAVSARTAGTSFVVTSTSITDTSTVAWFIVEPS